MVWSEHGLSTLQECTVQCTLRLLLRYFYCYYLGGVDIRIQINKYYTYCLYNRIEHDITVKEIIHCTTKRQKD